MTQDEYLAMLPVVYTALPYCTYREETFQYVDEWNNSNGDRTAYSYTRAAGHRKYKLSNHLGNVLATITDRKIFTHIKGDCKGGKCPIFEPDIASGTDYTPFGLAMAGRTYRSKGYRYGFNGKENDSDGEWGRGLIQDYGFRLYNPAASRFLSVDPLRMEYPWYTPYQFAGNKPIVAIDLDGLEENIVILHLSEKNQVSDISLITYKETATGLPVDVKLKDEKGKLVADGEKYLVLTKDFKGNLVKDSNGKTKVHHQGKEDPIVKFMEKAMYQKSRLNRKAGEKVLMENGGYVGDNFVNPTTATLYKIRVKTFPFMLSGTLQDDDVNQIVSASNTNSLLVAFSLQNVSEESKDFIEENMKHGSKAEKLITDFPIVSPHVEQNESAIILISLLKDIIPIDQPKSTTLKETKTTKRSKSDEDK